MSLILWSHSFAFCHFLAFFSQLWPCSYWWKNFRMSKFSIQQPLTIDWEYLYPAVHVFAINLTIKHAKSDNVDHFIRSYFTIAGLRLVKMVLKRAKNDLERNDLITMLIFPVDLWYFVFLRVNQLIIIMNKDLGEPDDVGLHTQSPSSSEFISIRLAPRGANGPPTQLPSCFFSSSFLCLQALPNFRLGATASWFLYFF